MRTCGKILLISLVTCLLAFPAGAVEKFPDRPIDLICPWGVGGGADQMARAIAKLAEKILGVSMPVSNMPGASGNTGVTNLLAAKADGYTILAYTHDTLSTISMATARHKVEDLEWIARTQLDTYFYFVKMDSRFKTAQDLLKYSKENPNKVKVATPGMGTIGDITVRYLNSKGYIMINVPFAQPGERFASVLGGHSEILWAQPGVVKQYLDANQLRPLIIFSEKRMPFFPEIPCSKELGFDLALPQFRSIVAKKGVPADRVQILSNAFKAATETPQWKKLNEEAYLIPDSFLGPDKFAMWAATEAEKMRKAMQTFGIIK